MHGVMYYITESSYKLDTLQIYNDTTTSELLYSFTGDDIPPVIMTPGPAITIVFYSDQLITYSGFTMNFSIGASTLVEVISPKCSKLP
jgi:hypothetical protein